MPLALQHLLVVNGQHPYKGIKHIGMTAFSIFEKIDQYLLLLINHDSDHAWLDNIMLLLRNPTTWIPLYAFILWYVYKKDSKQFLAFVVMSLLCFAVTDMMSAQLFKPLFARLRPCHDKELAGFIRVMVDCGGQYSFPSSHASNHFGLAVAWFWSIKLLTGRQWHWLWCWAAAICYAQVYVAKHYPSDILAGACFGWMIGGMAAKLFEKWLFILKKQSTLLSQPTTL